MLLAFALALPMQAAPQQPSFAASVELPAGPCRDALAARGDTLPGWAPYAFEPPGCYEDLARTLRDLPECLELRYTDRGWQDPKTWCTWAWLTQTEGPQRHDELARYALLQGRWDDAWDHLAAADLPETIVFAFLPGMPGVDPDHAQEPLPDNVLLTPAPPPPTPDAQPGFWDIREAWVRGLRVGGAVLDMRVAMEPEGIQIDFDHVSGEAATVRVQLPEPVGFQIRVEYVDWLRQDELGLPLEVTIAPGDETHSLYGRVLGRTPEWPTRTPEHVPAAIEDGGLSLVVDDDEPELERLQAVAAALGHGCQVVTRPPQRGVVIHLPPPGPTRDRKLAWLASSSEAFRLGRREQR